MPPARSHSSTRPSARRLIPVVLLVLLALLAPLALCASDVCLPGSAECQTTGGMPRITVVPDAPIAVGVVWAHALPCAAIPIPSPAETVSRVAEAERIPPASPPRLQARTPRAPPAAA